MSLPKGAFVLVGTYNLHRHPDFWTNAEQFRPERWLNGERLTSRYAYMPFGAGPRTCVGLHFASIEGPLLLALIGRHYDLKLAQDKVEAHLMVTLRPKGGIRMTLLPRKVPVASPAKLPVPNTGELS
ncbi:MAG: cytochrome P450 [Nitrospira sp.]|nr:cytochrome P450 [Nitrospira sp.]